MANELDLENIEGLKETEVARKIEEHGYNELPSTEKRSFLTIVLEVIREPMFLLLIACGAIYLVLGDLQEALMLLGFVFVIMGITFYQERKTERTLEALRDLSSPRALVIRDGREKRIPGREVVTGDIIMLKEGDRVPADAVVISCSNLLINESLLTGESVPVRKVQCGGFMDMHPPGGDGLPSVYSGTLVVQGQGVAQVVSIGLETEMGRIGKRLQSLETEDTSLQMETRTLVRNMALVGVALCAAVVIIYGLTRLDWLNGFLAGITLAMAILPEEFPVVLTIFLALGAWRISRKNVLTRRSHAIQALGSTTVLCVDKTGTLTLNQMSVGKIMNGAHFYDVNSQTDHLPESFHELVEFSILASQRDPFDPMEKSLKGFGDETLQETEHLHEDWQLVHEYPLSQELLAMSHVWQSPDGEDYIIAAKGAPEAVADLCHLKVDELEQLSRNISLMASEGLRIIGVARASFKSEDLPGKQHDFNFQFLGLVGFLDPVREEVPQAVEECYQAGIRVVMITGDYPGTARNIAQKIGLKQADNVITGDQLNEMDDETLKEQVKGVNIFARMVPEMKLRLVEALKSNGEIVAMTGDGVNDAPALKSAQIGISMGGRGTDVAREASALVLLEDDFSSIVASVKMGRRIYDNLKKATAYIFAVHVPIVGMSFLPVLFQWPLVLFPVQIVFLELIIDPACSVVFEAEPAESNAMKRPPRSSSEKLFSRENIGMSILQGIVVLVVVLAVYLVGLNWQGEESARTLSYITLIFANLALILTNRSWSRTIYQTLRSPNQALWWVLGGAVLFLGAILYFPPLQQLFKFCPLSLWEILLCFAAGMLSVLWFEGFKWIKNRGKGSNPN
ncbi:cation-translocating P-type ATPase [Methanobacterium sp.]|uniref:cation-translocating P-type ATPase n=1 Tax=Methanobacterium sp. TaxID=2164 RepID=UPI002ABAEBD7|nr:cation-translocating P-type ATPase [Methanobacterium sp.]MDY9922716.1 cation-translocating P-type ATPase [Methanobacterium sp.]